MKPWREKTPVLCIYEVVGRDYSRTVRLMESVMIEVEFSDQILAAFEAAMKRRQECWTIRNSTGPRPVEWTLVRYMTPTGEPNF